MVFNYRHTKPEDIERLFYIRANTGENPISESRLAEMGITKTAVLDGLALGTLCGWVCESGDDIVGFCQGDLTSGEVLVLALLPEFEGRGIGRKLLGRVVEALKQHGYTKIWLAADSNPDVRAHGFYRKLGWLPNGEQREYGDEILVLNAV